MIFTDPYRREGREEELKAEDDAREAEERK